MPCSCQNLLCYWPQFPQLTPKARVTDSHSSKGRCVVATERILPGEIIIRERPYAIMVYPECRESHCQLCFKNLGDSEDKITCERCQKVGQTRIRILSTCMCILYCFTMQRDHSFLWYGQTESREIDIWIDRLENSPRK